MSPTPITVSFCLSKCDRAELVTILDIVRARAARCIRLASAVPLDYVQGAEAEAARHHATARKIEDEIARQDHLEATRKAVHLAWKITKRAADAARRQTPPVV